MLRVTNKPIKLLWLRGAAYYGTVIIAALKRFIFQVPRGAMFLPTFISFYFWIFFFFVSKQERDKNFFRSFFLSFCTTTTSVLAKSYKTFFDVE
jgi:hypothetical protein